MLLHRMAGGANFRRIINRALPLSVIHFFETTTQIREDVKAWSLKG
jgi:hypothetical protein